MEQETQLVHFDRARQALAEAYRIDEVKLIRDQAEAIRLYIKQQRGSFEMQNQAAEIKLRAERRAGEMLKEVPRADPEDNLLHRVPSLGTRDVIPFEQVCKENDLAITTAQRWQLEAEIPEDAFEQLIAETKAEAEELTSKAIFALALKLRRQTQIQNVPDLPPGKYQVIYADPPWAYDNTGLGGSAESHYPTMTVNEIVKRVKKEDIDSLIEDDAVLFLWVTSPLLPEGLELCQKWGFEYKTSFVWIKDRSTYGKLGFYNYGQHEFLFVATKGSCLPRSGSLVPSLIVAPKGEHSAKPELVYEIIEGMYPGPYIELFARKRRANWETWGTL